MNSMFNPTMTTTTPEQQEEQPSAVKVLFDSMLAEANVSDEEIKDPWEGTWPEARIVGVDSGYTNSGDPRIMITWQPNPEDSQLHFKVGLGLPLSTFEPRRQHMFVNELRDYFGLTREEFNRVVTYDSAQAQNRALSSFAGLVGRKYAITVTNNNGFPRVKFQRGNK